jgi:hypothetical protein
MSEFKYLEVDVTRAQGSTVFLKVPADYDFQRARGFDAVLQQACAETVNEREWENDPVREIEWHSVTEVSKEVANGYKVFEVKI